MDDFLPVVIIGGGISGVSCVEQLAQQLTNRPIVLISASDVIKVASNVRRIGKTIDQFDVEEETHHYLVDKYKNIEIIIGKVVQLYVCEHRLRLESGQTVRYDKLCVCLGAVPKQLPIADSVNDKQRISEYIAVIRDTETVNHFQKRLKNCRKVVIVGNGGIATELVHRIADCQLIWCVKDDCVGAPYFDSMAAHFFLSSQNVSQNKSQTSEQTIVKRLKYTSVKPNKVKESNEISSDETFDTALGPDWYQNLAISGSDVKSVKIEYNCEVRHIFASVDVSAEVEKSSLEPKDNWPVFVELTNGQTHGCDLIVSAIGVIPNTEPVIKGNHIDIGPDGGLLINEQMMTTAVDVYAAGDVCSVGWNSSELWFQMRLWTQARQMGLYAGLCIAAQINKTSAELFFNFELFTHMTKFFGYKVVLLGLYNGQGLEPNQYHTMVRVTENKEFVKIIMKEHRMVGAILVGETDLEETFENLILNGIDLSRFGDHLLDNIVDIDDYFD